MRGRTETSHFPNIDKKKVRLAMSLLLLGSGMGAVLAQDSPPPYPIVDLSNPAKWAQEQDQWFDRVLVPTETESAWEKYQVGDVLYGQAQITPAGFYTAPSMDAPQVENYPLEKRFTTPVRNPIRFQINPGAMLRLRKVNDLFGEIIPENGVDSPLGDTKQTLYVLLVDFEPKSEFEPISIFPETRNQEKLIVVVADEHPEMYVLEAGKVVMHIPVVLGGTYGDSNTPMVDSRIYMTRASSNMPGYPAVGFAMYFSAGFAVHEEDWLRVNHFITGGYGSGGCVNLPPGDWFKVAGPQGKTLAVPEFMFDWVRTNISYDPKVAEMAITNWNDPGYNEGLTSVRMMTMRDLNNIYGYVPPERLDPKSQYTTWDDPVANIKAGRDSWIMPNYNDSTNSYDLIHIPKGTLPTSTNDMMRGGRPPEVP